MDPAKARWSFEVGGKEVRVGGRLLRIGFLDGEGYQFLNDPLAALADVRNFRPKIDIFTFIQHLSDSTPRYKFLMELDNFAAIRVTTFDEWMTRQVDFKVRNKVRKSTKNGVVVREVLFDDSLIQGISAIYNETPVRQGRQFPHYQKDIEALRRMKATFLERSIFIGAFFEGNLIGFIKLVADEGRTQAGLMHILSMIRHRDKAPTNALIAQAVRSCADRGIPYLWYANMDYGKKQGGSLAEFKRHNGFERIEIPRYYIPLTLAGRAALRLGLHHEILDWVPESVVAQFRRVRSFWYAKRSPGLESA
jgi:hypothetical protein